MKFYVILIIITCIMTLESKKRRHTHSIILENDVTNLSPKGIGAIAFFPIPISVLERGSFMSSYKHHTSNFCINVNTEEG